MADNRKLADLIPDHANANKGTERGRYALEASLRQYGAGRSILLDKNGRIIAGNKTAEVAADIGLEDVVIVQTDGTQIVAVQRTDLDIDSAEGRGLAYADNRVGELSLDWDAEQVLADINAGVDVSALFRQDELDVMLDGLLDAASKSQDDFADFGNVTGDDGFIAFKFGDYAGRVSKELYQSFVDAYKEQQSASGEVMIDDVLRSWLNV